MDWQKIAVGAFEVFMKYGVKSVTMDDLASRLAISKKTLYKHVDNKADLVMKVMNMTIGMDKQTIDSIRNTAPNAIQELIMLGDYHHQKFGKMNPAIMFDIQKYYPKSWTVLRKHHDEFVFNFMVDNIKKGIKQGLYREDLDAEMVSKLFCLLIDHLDELVGNDKAFDFGHLVDTHNSYHVHGIASKKGLTVWNKAKKQ